MIRIFIACCVLASVARAADPIAGQAPGQGPVVMLKLDDFTRPLGKGDTLPYDRWRKVADFLATEGVKANFGMFAESLEGECPTYVAWIKDHAASGMVEFWHHGYYNKFPDARKTATREGEFKGATAAEQGELLRKSLEQMQAKTGLTMIAYGPHGMPLAGADAAAAYEAMAGIPQLKAVWYYGPPKGTATDKVVVPRLMELEYPTLKPDAAKMIENFEKKGRNMPFFAMQGHPGSWDDQRYAEFEKAVRYLKTQGCRFVTISEWLAANTKPAVK